MRNCVGFFYIQVFKKLIIKGIIIPTIAYGTQFKQCYGNGK